MKLSECTHGRIVNRTDQAGGEKLGMIVGISEMTTEDSVSGNPDYAIPLVQWQTGETSPINHNNIELYEG